MKLFPLQHKKNGFNSLSKVDGFTLVETLVAISILLIVIIGPMTVAQKGIQNAYYARDQLTAVFLAQEAIEAVRERRDDAGLYVFDKLVEEEDLSPDESAWMWYDDLDDACKGDVSDTTKGCKFEIESDGDRVFDECGDIAGGCRLQVKDGVYSYKVEDGGGLSPFTRKVYIEENAAGNAVKVHVVVTWNATTFGGAERTVELQTWLYDRYKYYESD